MLTLSATLSCGSKSSSENANNSTQTVVVTAMTTNLSDVPQFIPSVGTLRANQISTIAPEVPGRLMEIRFADGQQVVKDDVLAIIDNRTELATYQAAVAAYKENEWKFQQTRDLFKAQAATDYEVTQARFARDRSASLVKEARERLDKLTIVAPYDGRLSIRIPDVGDYLADGSPIVDIVDDDPMLVDYYLAEQYIDLLTIDQAVFIQFPNEDRIYQGTVEAISPLINEISRSVKVRARFPNPSQELASGRFVTVKHQIGMLNNVILVPQEAVALSNNQANVYVINQINQEDSSTSKNATQYAEQRAVILGEYFGNQVIIKEGLQPDESIVVTGWDKLRDNTPVKVIPGIPTIQTPTTTWIEPKAISQPANTTDLSEDQPQKSQINEPQQNEIQPTEKELENAPNIPEVDNK